MVHPVAVRGAPFWMAGAVGLGVAAVLAPNAALAIAIALVLAVLPLHWLFAVLVASSAAQSVTLSVAGFTVRPDELVVVVFAARAFAARDRAALRWPEWLLLAFLGLQVVTSALHAADARASILSVGLLGFGVVAYLSTVTAVSTRERFAPAVRAALIVLAVSEAIGLLALVAHWASGSSWGITRVDTLAGFPAITGLAHEHDLYGSMAAVGTVVFLALWRQRNSIVGRNAALLGFWISAAGLLLSLTRGAWVAAAIGIVAVALLTRPSDRSRSLPRLAVGGAAMVALAAALLVGLGAAPDLGDVGSSTVSTVTEQAGQVLDFGSSTGAARVAEWRISLDEWRHAPVFGLGTNSFGQRHFEMSINGPIPAFVGNWVIRTLYDSGVIGLAMLATSLGALLWPSRALRVVDGDAGVVARSLLCGGIVIVVAYLAADGLLLVWPWILFGLSRAARRLAATEPAVSA